MSVDPKIIDRIEKLLRLAAPSTNSEHERTSAALEAARLFSEHPVVIAPKEKKRSSRSRAKPSTPPPQHQSPWAPTIVPQDFGQRPGWCRSVAARDSVCDIEDCGGAIYRGDPVWMCMEGYRVKYIHVDGPCDV
jgi:hypothetical protein